MNNTERKEIGVPILKRTDEMISEFDLDYEKNFKISKYHNLDKEFKEFLRMQEQHEFYLSHLVKLLKIYFRENNYNSNTYYFQYLYNNKSSTKRKHKRTKSFKFPKNKFKYYYIFKNSINYNNHQPWIYPLGIKDKKNFIHKKLKTETNNYKKKGTIKIAQSVLKLYIEHFGQVPVNYVQKENNKNNKAQKRANSSYNNLRNVFYRSKGFDDKTHLLLKKGMIINKKYFGNFEKLKKYVYMKKRNVLNIKAKSLSSYTNNKILARKRNNSASSVLINKRIINNNNNSSTNQNQKTNDTRYMNLKNFTAINKTNAFRHNNSISNYYNNSSMNSISSGNNKLKMNQNKINNNMYFLESKNNYNNNFKKNLTQNDILRFQNEFTKSIKKSKIFQKLSFMKDFNKQRELRKYKYLDIDSDSYDQSDESKNEFNDENLYMKNTNKSLINQKKQIFHKFKLKKRSFGY